MRVGSLFAGIGGFDLAAERAGMEVVWQSEIDKHASRVLAHHWPEVPNHGDIHDIRTETPKQRDERPTVQAGAGVHVGGTGPRRSSDSQGGTNDRGGIPGVDVLTGGFPCQDYSVAGTRGGLAGDRGALWWEYHRLIAGLHPTWVVGENVPGLLSSRDGADFETIVGSLTELGYGVAWAVLDAQYFGVAQRRRRVFIVGHSGGEPRPEILALGEGVFGHLEPSRTEGQDIAGTPAPGSQSGGQRSTDLDGHGAWVYNEVSGEDYRESEQTQALTEGAGSRRIEQIVFESSRRDGVRVQDDQSPTLQAQMGTGGLNTPMVAFAQNQRDEVRYLGDVAGGLQSETGMKQQTYVVHENLGGHVTEADHARSLRAGASKSYQFVNATTVRRLTPLECERLQGFPDGWTDIPGNSDTQRYRQLGNAVAVPVVEWLMRRIVEVSG